VGCRHNCIKLDFSYSFEKHLSVVCDKRRQSSTTAATMVKAVTLFICALLAVPSASAKHVQSIGADAALEHVKGNAAELQRTLKDSPEQEAAKDASKR
jgi:hypothetical protein